MNSTAAHTLETSTIPGDVLRAGAALAKSSDAADHSALARLLANTAALHRFNTATEYDTTDALRLRVAAVIKGLRDNRAPSAAEALGQLMTTGAFTEHLTLQEMLLRASIDLRPPPRGALRFWEIHGAPETTHQNLTVVVLCDNATVPAINALEKILSDPRNDPIMRRSWMRGPLLIHRQDTPLLEGCERLLQTIREIEVRHALVEALVTYDQTWYSTCNPPKPPSRAALSEPSRKVLERICRLALEKLQLPEVLTIQVKALLESITPRNRKPA